MDRRSTGGYMDFEYQNKTGPIGEDAPFLKFTAQQREQTPSSNMTNKRPFSAFASPDKASGFGNLRPSSSSSSTFFSPSQNQGNAAFSTPRISRETEIPSSGPETSPDNHADSEATPEMKAMGIRGGLNKPSNLMRSFMANSGPSAHAQKSDQNSPLVKTSKPASGRGEIPREQFSNKIMKRATRNRRRTGDGNRALVHLRAGSTDNSDASDAIDGEKPSPQHPHKKARIEGSSTNESAARPGVLASLFTFLETHPALPHILSFYAQLLLNVFLVLAIIYLIATFWSTIRADVDKKSEEAIADLLAEMAICAKDYTANGCDIADNTDGSGRTLPPALEAVCANWKKCMTRDPRRVGRARVSAHTFAEIFNSFVEPISIKAMIFTALLIIGCFTVSNLTFSLFRHKATSQWGPPAPAPQPLQQSYPTPQGPLHLSSPAAHPHTPHAHGGTPWHAGLAPPEYYWTPSGARGAWSPGEGSPSRRVGDGSPARRLAFH